MNKELLEECLAEGMSLEAIGERVGKHESTVSYWLKKHGLEAARAEKHSAPRVRRQRRRWNGFFASGGHYANLRKSWIGAWRPFGTGCESTSSRRFPIDTGALKMGGERRP